MNTGQLICVHTNAKLFPFESKAEVPSIAKPLPHAVLSQVKTLNPAGSPDTLNVADPGPPKVENEAPFAVSSTPSAMYCTTEFTVNTSPTIVPSTEPVIVRGAFGPAELYAKVATMRFAME